MICMYEDTFVRYGAATTDVIKAMAASSCAPHPPPYTPPPHPRPHHHPHLGKKRKQWSKTLLSFGREVHVYPY